MTSPITGDRSSPHPPPPRPVPGAGRFTDLALLLLLATLWGGSYSFIKVGVETIPPVTLIAARTLLAGAILLAVNGWRGLRLPRDLGSWRLFLVQACLNSVMPFTLIAWAERGVAAGLATILSSTSPIFVGWSSACWPEPASGCRRSGSSGSRRAWREPC